MNSQNLKSTGGVIAIFMFISGIGLMIISEGIDIIFGVGLLFFLTSVVIGIILITWSIAGTVDKTLRRFTGESD